MASAFKKALDGLIEIFKGKPADPPSASTDTATENPTPAAEKSTEAPTPPKPKA